MPASRRVSQRQLEILLDFAEANKDIALGRCNRGPHASQLIQQAWNTIAIKLNSGADGVTKTGDQWRRYWIELKAKTKAKGADVRRNASKTGGGPNKLIPLNELEERILQLIGRVSVEGLPGVRIPFPTPSQTTSMLPSQPSTSQATDPTYHQESPSFSPMEIEWLEDEILSSLSQSPSILPTSQTVPTEPQLTPPPPEPPLSPHPVSPPQNPPQISPRRRPPAPSAQSSPRRRRRPQHMIRDRAVPQWALNLEERRLLIEERHTRALEALNDTIDQRLVNLLDRRLANIENILNKISNNKS